MRYVITSRQGGKTAALLSWMRVSEDRVMLCHSEHEAERLRAANKDIAPDRFTTTHSVHRLLGRRIRLCVDNAEVVLQTLLSPHPVDVLSMTEEFTEVEP